jgi:hypothetical protein
MSISFDLVLLPPSAAAGLYLSTVVPLTKLHNKPADVAYRAAVSDGVPQLLVTQGRTIGAHWTRKQIGAGGEREGARRREVDTLNQCESAQVLFSA